MERKAIVIGLYGLPGAGKTTTLAWLRDRLDDDRFVLFEGSNLIAEQCGRRLRAFQVLDVGGKKRCREQAILHAAKEGHESGKAALIVGHYMFWDDETSPPELMWTETDGTTFTHIVYLQVNAETIMQRREADTRRHRPRLPANHLHTWQQQEIQELRQTCYKSGILFTVIANPDRLPSLLESFQLHNEQMNATWATSALDKGLSSGNFETPTALVFDGDKTLISEDSGTTFFDKTTHHQDALKALFESAGYSYTSFRQAMLLCEEVADDEQFDSICTEVASASHINPRIESLLRMAEDPTHVAAIVITCGLRVVFEKVLERFNLHEVIKVVGGGRLADDYIVTPDLKSALVRRLQERYNIGVWAFGNSPLDLPMLKQADHAIVVVGDEQTRSRSMDVPLRHAIETDGLHAHQLLCRGNTSPRLNQKLLPIIRNEEIAAQFPCPRGMKILHASSRHAAVLLSAPMRDASISGPALREAHRRLGCFLATELLSRVIGLEEYPIQHVQGHTTRGHRIRDEAKTCIVAIMRGGQPIAKSVADALPRAMLLHANESEDVTPQYLEGLSAVALVDAVINTGKSMVEFVHRIKHLCPKLRIAIVAGTVQQKAIGDHGTLTKPLSGYTGLSLAALRVSENSFAGTRGTDTGNRLFNTTHLE